MEKYFEKVKKNFGFGCMRLPMEGGKVRDEEFIKMADAFLPDAFQSERKGKVDQNDEEADAVNAGEFADLDHGKDAPLTAAGEIPRQSGENP